MTAAEFVAKLLLVADFDNTLSADVAAQTAFYNMYGVAFNPLVTPASRLASSNAPAMSTSN